MKLWSSLQVDLRQAEIRFGQSEMAAEDIFDPVVRMTSHCD